MSETVSPYEGALAKVEERAQARLKKLVAEAERSSRLLQYVSASELP